ncbi:MAG: hypothetical protein NT171_06810 [Planctomycetota bacterium]|nr:hypothetical protein [Planctomycetota bacterium]
MTFSALMSSEQPGATAADGGRRRPGWRREQIVWVFQGLFWLAVSATLCGFSVALRPDEPLPWGAIGLRVVTGFTVTSPSSMPLKVNVRASVKDDWLEVVVANSGQWVAPDTTRSPGTGIRSLRRRLELLIDASATVDVQLDPDLDDGWVRIVIRMPANVRAAAADRAGEPA